jgi:hypothetical protein
MKPKHHVWIVILLLFLCNSCAFHKGVMTGNASLQGSNFEIIDMATGKASTVKVLGIGGLNKNALVLEAKRDLYSKYPLSIGQAFANVSVDFKNSYILVVSITDVTISADIVQFFEKGNYQDTLQTIFHRRPEKVLAKPIENKSRPVRLTEEESKLVNKYTGDPVRFVSDSRVANGYIVKSTVNDHVFYVKQSINERSATIHKLSKGEVFFMNNKIEKSTDLKIGDKIEYSDGNFVRSGMIAGFGFDQILVRNLSDNQAATIPYQEYNRLKE